jgi:hypothetical protein
MERGPAGFDTVEAYPRIARVKEAVVSFRGSMWYGSSEVPCTEIRLLSGDVFTVEGNTDEVERALSDAARSGQSRLAWLAECDKGHPIGINPTHVIAVRPSEISD